MKFHSDEQKAELLGRGKPAWYTQASVQASTATPVSTELPVSVSSVASKPASESIIDVDDIDESDGEILEVGPLKTGEDNDNAQSSREKHQVNVQTMSVANKLALEKAEASKTSPQEFFKSDFGSMLGKFVQNANHNNGKVWFGPLVHLPEIDKSLGQFDGDRAVLTRKMAHDAAGNTTFPCPADLVAYLQPRPTLSVVNSLHWRQPSHPRRLEEVSEASYEDWFSDEDSIDSVEQEYRDENRSFQLAVGFPNSRRFRMP
jgi:hypothetical protein